MQALPNSVKSGRAMATLCLREGVHCCIANGRTAFLDVNADRYFGLPESMEADFQAFMKDGRHIVNLPRSLTPLLSAALIERREAAPFASAYTIPPGPVLAGASDIAMEQPSALDIVDALWSQIRVARMLRSSPLKTCLTNIPARKKATSQKYPLPPARLVAAFLSTKRFVGTQDRCLRWSLAMIDFLARHEYYPQLVLGVRMAPFAAHAWVQHGNIVLNDEVDQVRPYSAILVI